MSDLFDFAPTYTVNGTVTNSLGQPMVGANVTNGLGVTVSTNESGNYSMTLPDGAYVLTANVTGYGPDSQNVTVSGADQGGVDFVAGP
jgi:hypothetical protein